MKKIFKSNKSKGKSPAPEPVGDAELDSPGYSLKEKDLPKLHKSAWSGDLTKVQQLSKKGDVNQLDKENRTALHLACANGHKEVAAFLVSSKAKLNLCDNDQRSPLMKAAQGNHVACVETLLRNSADPNLVDKDGNTALHLGAHGGFVDVVLLLLKGGAMVNAPNKNGSTPLHLCADAKQDVMAEVLLDNDADVNATDNTNRTPLMLACQSDQIGLVKLLLDRKADTEIKDSKGWTANDHAIMGGFHGCSHLIDEFNSSRRPRASVGRPGSSMFGSTGGSEGVGLGFSLGGGSARDEYDDEEDDLSVGKDSFGEDSWGASASEADEPVKPKPKVSKAVKLNKFIAVSDDESIKSADVSQRSTASKSRIPRAVSKDSLASAASAHSAGRSSQDGSKIPRLSTKPADPAAATNSPAKAKESAGRGRSVSDVDPWDDTPTPTPRENDLQGDNFPATPRGGPFTPRSSAISMGESGSEWDDDDVLGALEGTSPQKMPSISEKKREHQNSTKPDGLLEKRPLSSQDKQQRKDVLNQLGMSDVEDDDDSSLHFTDEEPKRASTVKRGLQPNLIIKAEDSPVASKAPKTADAEEEDEESDWDSDDDLLPSNASDTKGPPVIKPGDSGIQTNSDSLGSKPKPVSQTTPSVSPRVERKLPPTPVRETPRKAEGTGEKHPVLGGVKEDAGRQGEAEEEDDDDWDSDEEDEEEESEWERARKEEASGRASAHEELKQAAKTEASRQQQWEKEQAELEKKRRQEAEAELRREQEEIERERQQREKEEREERERAEQERRERERRETERRREEEERARQEKEKRDQEEAERRRRDEEKHAEEERRRRRLEEECLQKMEQELKEKQKEEERQREERRQKEEEERKKREEELRLEMEKMKTEEERNEAERLHLKKERQQLEEERRQEELRRDEENKRLDMETKIKQERMEAERVKFEAERRIEEKRLEEERKRFEDAQKLEKQMQEEARRKFEDEMRQKEEEYKRHEDERKRMEKEKEELKTLRLEQEEARQKLEADRRREEERRKFEEERIKREEERLEMERKKVEEEAKKRQRELLQGISSKSEIEKKQFEDELRRLEEEREREIKRRVEEFEEDKLRQTAEKTALQKELELQSQRFREEKLKFEARQKEAEEQRQLEESRREDDLKKMTEERTREMEQLKAEKLRLQKENEAIERKRQEIQAMKQEAEQKESERNLRRYQKSIERRLQDEEGSDVVTADGDHSSDIDADLHEMEAAVVAKQQQNLQGISPILSGSRGQNTNMNNGLDSQGNTAEFNQGLLGNNPHNPLHSTAATRSLRLSGSRRGLTNGNPYGLHLNSKQPAWQAVLNEPDGLDSSSTDEDDDDDPAAAEELRASLLSPYLASTPLNLNTNQNAGGSSPPDGALDPAAFVRLQGQLREQKRIADREKGLRTNAENHCRGLEADVEDKHRRVEELTRVKTALDQQQLELEARIRTLEHELSQELEKRRNAEVLLDKTKEQLIRKEELFALEIEAKQKAELASRNLSLELRTAQNLVRQFEEERDELRSQLLHEKHARALQEDLVQEQLHAQDALHQETSRFFTEKAEAVSRLEAADESRKVMLSQSDRLKTELSALKLEMERQKLRHRDDQGMLTSENEELSNKIEELKNEIRVSEEALAHATMAYNSQLMAVKTENAMLHGAVEKEMNKADKLQTKLDSVDRRLQSTSQELEKSEQARSDLERSFQREKDDWGRSRDKLEAEVISLREAAQATSRKYAATESKLRSVEKELQVAGTSLMERSNQLTSLQRELDSRNTQQSSHNTLLQKEKEDNYKISARMESMVERLNDAQTEIGKLRRSLETAQQEKLQRDKDLLDAQEKFSNTLKTLQAENDRMRTVWEERVSTSSENISRLKEELQRSEHNRSLRDQEIRQIQQELTEALRKLSIAEANLELARKSQNELDKDKQQAVHNMKQVQNQISSMERDRRSLEARIEDLQSDLMQTQRNNMNTSQQLMATQTSLQRKSELEDRLRELETENARMEAVIKQERNRNESLRREVDDSNKMRVSLEDLVSNLQTSSMRMEGKLQEEAANRSLFAKEAEDHKGLWEMEVKSRSRLGLRIAQLERAKTEVQAQVNEEKKKVRKMAEMKRSYEERWQSEVQRTQLQEQEMSTLKAKLKAAKKKLKDLDAPELRLNTLQTGFERERLNMEATVATQRRQIDDLNQQLEREASLRADVEKNYRHLQQELSSSKTVGKERDKLERAKRKLEDELAEMKMLVQQNFIEKGELEKYKQQLDAKARMEVNEKLDQVNSYLEEQSQAREKLEMLRNSNENELRKEQENTINDLKNEMGRLHSSYHDVLAQKETLEVEVARFKELYQDAVKKQDRMASQLEKAQDKLVDTQAKFTLQKQRNRQMLDGSLDVSPRHLAKKPAQSPHVDSITEKVWSELDKSITRHLQAAPTDVGPTLAELRAGSLSRSYDGYNSPLRHENNQYLATLRKNYFV